MEVFALGRFSVDELHFAALGKGVGFADGLGAHEAEDGVGGGLGVACALLLEEGDDALVGEEVGDVGEVIPGVLLQVKKDLLQ